MDSQLCQHVYQNVKTITNNIGSAYCMNAHMLGTYVSVCTVAQVDRAVHYSVLGWLGGFVCVSVVLRCQDDSSDNSSNSGWWVVNWHCSLSSGAATSHAYEFNNSLNVSRSSVEFSLKFSFHRQLKWQTSAAILAQDSWPWIPKFPHPPHLWKLWMIAAEGWDFLKVGFVQIGHLNFSNAQVSFE